MEIAKTLERLNKTHVLDKQTRTELIGFLKMFEGIDVLPDMGENSKHYKENLNREEKNRLLMIRGFARELGKIGNDTIRFGYEQDGRVIRLAFRLLDLVGKRFKNAFSNEQNEVFERQERNRVVRITATDEMRCTPDKADDEKVTVSTDDLYNLSEQVLAGCAATCDGTAKQCEFRESMVRMCIPVNDASDRCPYWTEHEKKVGIA